MQIQRATLQDALKRVLSGSADSESWDSVIFHGGWLSSYNDTISISAKVEGLEDLNATIKLKDFQKLVQKCRGDVVEIQDVEDKIVLDCGKTHAELAKFPDAISQYIGALALDKIQWADIPENFTACLALCRLEFNKLTKRPMVHVTGSDMLADEGIRSNYGVLSAEMPTFSIHSACAKELLAMGSLQSYEVADPWVHFCMESGAIFSAKCFPEPYPASNVLAVKTVVDSLDPVFSMPIPSGLLDAVDRVAVFAGAADITGTLYVDVQVREDAMVLRTGKEAGKVSETILWDKALPEGTDINFQVSVAFLREAAGKLTEMSVVMYPTFPKVAGIPREQWPRIDTPRFVFRGESFVQVVQIIPKD